MFKLENRGRVMLLFHSNLDYKSTLPWTSEHFCLLSCLICVWPKGRSCFVVFCFFFFFSSTTQKTWNRNSSGKEQPGKQSKTTQQQSVYWGNHWKQTGAPGILPNRRFGKNLGAREKTPNFATWINSLCSFQEDGEWGELLSQKERKRVDVY